MVVFTPRHSPAHRFSHSPSFLPTDAARHLSNSSGFTCLWRLEDSPRRPSPPAGECGQGESAGISPSGGSRVGAVLFPLLTRARPDVDDGINPATIACKRVGRRVPGLPFGFSQPTLRAQEEGRRDRTFHSHLPP